MITGAPMENHSWPYSSSISAKASASQALAKADTRNITPNRVVDIYDKYFIKIAAKVQKKLHMCKKYRYLLAQKEKFY
jgi:hypothetical protein